MCVVCQNSSSCTILLHTEACLKLVQLKTLVLNSLILFFMVMFFDLHVFPCVVNSWLAFHIFDVTSFSVSPLGVILDPRHMYSYTSSTSPSFLASVLLFIPSLFCLAPLLQISHLFYIVSKSGLTRE